MAIDAEATYQSFKEQFRELPIDRLDRVIRICENRARVLVRGTEEHQVNALMLLAALSITILGREPGLSDLDFDLETPTKIKQNRR
jgi:hypothetical protein